MGGCAVSGQMLVHFIISNSLSLGDEYDTRRYCFVFLIAYFIVISSTDALMHHERHAHHFDPLFIAKWISRTISVKLQASPPVQIYTSPDNNPLIHAIFTLQTISSHAS